MKKLVMLSNPLVTYGGGERWLLETASLLKDKLEITILNPVSDIDVKRIKIKDIKKHYDISGINIVDLKCKGKNTTFPGFGSFIRMIPSIESKQKLELIIKECDVVYAVSANPYLLMLCIRLAKKYNKKMIFGLHNPEFIRHVNDTDKISRRMSVNIYNILQKKLIESIGNVHVQTKSQVKRLLDIGYSGKVYYVPNYLYKNIVLKNENAHKKFVVLFVGRLIVKHKGIDLFEKIVDNVLSTCDKIEFRVIGSGSEGKQIINGLKNRHGANFVVLGFLSEEKLEKEYLGADLFVLTSRYENPGLSLLEAQAHGLPVVAFGVPGPKDIVKKNFQGILIKPFDTERFAKGILKYYVCKNQNDRKFSIIKARIYNEIKRRYDKQKFINDFMKMIVD